MPLTEHPKRILLAVTGLSPQVVTETVYALAVQRTPGWCPTEVHVITTRRGADNVRLRLLSDDPGWFARLRRDYDLPPIAFDESRIHLIEHRDGRALDDIRDDGDSAAAADTISAVVRTLTADADSALHASIAGGRKTMGYLLGAAMSLYGRPQDALSHVLVEPPFEAHPEFFYPTPQSRVITALDRSGEALDCRQARVWLGEIPFVRLRQHLPAALGAQRLSFAELIGRANRVLQAEDWHLDPGEPLLAVGDQRIGLSDRDWALLLLLGACTRLQSGIPAPSKAERADAQWAQLARERLLQAWREEGLSAARRAADLIDAWMRDVGDTRSRQFAQEFEQTLSRLRRKLRTQLGLPKFDFERRAPGARGNRRAYALALPAARVRLRRIGGEAGTANIERG